MNADPIGQLMKYLKAYPDVYAPSSAPFWDDAHISKSMLRAHLDPNTDAASRRPAFLRASADWIARYCGAAAGKQLLDLGCGPGLYAELFAERGLSVTGIDLSPRSVAYAEECKKATGSGVRYLCQNYLELDSEDGFDAVTLIYCDFGVLSPKDRRRLLQRIRRALRPGGVLILDAHSTVYGEAFREGETVETRESGFWSPEPHVCIQRSRLYRETDNVLDQYLVLTKTACSCYNTWNQIYSGPALLAELQDAGFPGAELFDDVSGAPYTGNSETLCIAAQI